MQQQQQKVIYHPKKQLLSCRLCTDIFKKPVTLACGHTFCYNCLYKFMKQHCASRKEKQLDLKKREQQNNNNQISFDINCSIQNQKSDNMPLPLCPTCSSLIFRPIRNLKQNLTLSNLIEHAKYKPELKFQNLIYDQEIQNFEHRILINIQQPKIDPLPFAHSQIRFKTCFLDQILEQSHSSFIVIEWNKFKKDMGLAGKLQRVQVQYRSTSSHNKQNHYRGYFIGMYFVKISKRKLIEINLKSRYYTEATLYSQEQQQFASLNICKCEQYHSMNIQPLSSFDPFLYFYDRLSNPHYINQINRLIDARPLFERNNPQNMIYNVIRILKLPNQQKKSIILSFDDQIRIQRINQFLQKMQNQPIEQFIQISIPGKYNSLFVFGVIFILMFLHYFQSN